MTINVTITPPDGWVELLATGKNAYVTFNNNGVMFALSTATPSADLIGHRATSKLFDLTTAGTGIPNQALYAKAAGRETTIAVVSEY